MNKLTAIIAAVALVSAASLATAGEPDQPATAATAATTALSQAADTRPVAAPAGKTRAQVRAELAEARSRGELENGYGYGFYDAPRGAEHKRVASASKPAVTP